MHATTGLFATTRWDIIEAAKTGGNPTAWESVMSLYWLPLYAYGRARGVGPEDAADAVQVVLGKIYERNSLRTMDSREGRFRDFLKVSLLNHLTSEHRAATNSLRRPENGFVHPTLEELESKYSGLNASFRTPDRVFDRIWAESVLDSVRTRLRQHYQESGKEGLFDHLLTHLDQGDDAISHETAAARLGLSAGTVRNAMGSFKERFSRMLREYLAETVGPNGDVDAEMRSLRAAFDV